MTLGASDFVMSIDEREFRLAMIEGAGFLPRQFIVAGLARLAQLALVRISLFVTIDASVWRIAVWFACFVAALARNTFVPAFQLKVCLVVVEGAFIETRYVTVRSLMFGMAVAAFSCSGSRVLCMKPLRLLLVCSNLFMAVETHRRLCVAPEGRMALVATLLEFLVSFGERAGHDELFENALPNS